MNNMKNIVTINDYRNYKKNSKATRIKELKKKVFEVLAFISMIIPVVMILTAIFIDYTETEKNFMFVFLGLGVVFMIISDPKETFEFFKVVFSTKSIEEDDYEDYIIDDYSAEEIRKMWIESAGAYYDPAEEAFFYYDSDEDDFFYFNNEEQEAMRKKFYNYI